VTSSWSFFFNYYNDARSNKHYNRELFYTEFRSLLESALQRGAL